MMKGKKRFMFKRVISILMVLLIIIGAGACNDQEKKKTEADDFSMTNVASYEEKEIGSTIGFNWPGIKMQLDSKQQIIMYDYREKGTFCIVADGNGKSEQEYKNASKDEYVFTLDAKDNRYSVCRMLSSGKENDKEKEATYTLNIYNSKGEEQKSFDLGKRTITKELEGITDIAVDKKGITYLLMKRQNIEVIGLDGKKVKDIPAPKADYIEIDEEDNLLVGSINGGENSPSIEKYNPSNEERIWTKKLVVGSGMQEMKYSQKNKTLYIFTQKGILSCSPEGSIEGYIFDLKQFSLGESGIYVSDFDIDSDKNIYILALKNNPSGKSTPLFYKYTTIRDDKKSKNQKTLTLSLWYTDRLMESAISKFKKAYPNIKVEVKDYAANGITSEVWENYQKTINTELMAGNGADIMEMTELPYKKYADKNVLANMSEMIKNDSSFDLGKYQQGLLNACKYKSNLYIMPYSFFFTLFAANKNILSAEGINIDSSKCTWNEFLSIAQKITKDTNGDGKPDQYALPNMTIDEIFSYIFFHSGEYHNFVDFEKRKVNFDSREFKDIMKFTKDLMGKGVCSPMDVNNLREENSKENASMIGFLPSFYGSYDHIIFDQSSFDGEVEYLYMPSYSGKTNLQDFRPGSILAINNNSAKKSEAWEFIKFLLSDEIQNNIEMTDEFPVNLNALKEKAKIAITNKDYKIAKAKGKNVKPLTQVDIDMVNKIIDGLNKISYIEPEAERIISEGVDEFFSGKKTAEEAAKQIQNKMNIYLGE